MSTINVKLYKVIAGAYKDKYIAVAESLNIGLSSPVEVVDTDTYKVNLPDYNNFNANGTVESTLLLVEDSVTVEQILAFTNKAGFAQAGNLFLYQNTQMFFISNDLTTSKVNVVFYGMLSQNAFNGSKYVLYTAGAASSVYTIS